MRIWSLRPWKCYSFKLLIKAYFVFIFQVIGGSEKYDNLCLGLELMVVWVRLFSYDPIGIISICKLFYG